MTYVIYNGKGAKDGRGYETWFAESDDLLHWNTKGRVLSFRDRDVGLQSTRRIPCIAGYGMGRKLCFTNV